MSSAASISMLMSARPLPQCTRPRLLTDPSNITTAARSAYAGPLPAPSSEGA
ncbi:hypothetical protein [Streptomyces sp. NPDC059076]|uniref:hypothetical protein n=1 Tax=unclassified Streptomyces TaxID=2593676 RepID=UPI0036984312